MVQHELLGKKKKKKPTKKVSLSRYSKARLRSLHGQEGKSKKAATLVYHPLKPHSNSFQWFRAIMRTQQNSKTSLQRFTSNYKMTERHKHID